MAEEGYGAIYDTTTAELPNGIPEAADTRVITHLGDGVNIHQEPEKLPTRRAVCALLAAAVCGFITVWSFASVDSTTDAVERLWHHELKHVSVCADYQVEDWNKDTRDAVMICMLLDATKMCNITGHVSQPVYIGMLQAALISVIMTVLAMLPEPLGGGDPWTPGLAGLAFAGWNVLLGCWAAAGPYILLFMPPEDRSADIQNFFDLFDWVGVYEFFFLATLHTPAFQALCTIAMQKMVVGYYTILRTDKECVDKTKMTCCRKTCSIIITILSVAGVLAVVGPVTYTHLRLQLIYFPIAIQQDVDDSQFYGMIAMISCAVLVTLALILGPGVGLMRLSAHFHPPTIGNDKTLAVKFITNKCSAIISFLFVAFYQDFTINSALVLHNVTEPGKALVAPFSARNTCDWATCLHNTTNQASWIDYAKSWATLTPVLELAGSFKGDCVDDNGDVVIKGHVLVPTILGAILCVVCCVSLYLNLGFLRRVMAGSCCQK